MVEVRACALTSCFIRHLPSSVSSALAGGVTSVAIASSSAEQSKGSTVNMASRGLRETQGGTVRTKLGTRGQHTASLCLHSLPEHPSPSRKHIPFVGQEGHPTSYLQLLGRPCTSPSSPQPSSWYLKNQLLQRATCEPYSTFLG